MKVLIVCSGNSRDSSVFDIKLHHPFIFEQAQSLIEEGIEIDYFFITGKGLTGYIKSWYRLWGYLRLKKYKLIHAHSGLSGLIAVIQPYCKTIVTFHGSDINQKKTRWISNIASLLASYRIFVSPYLHEKLYLKPARNYSVIPCGVNLRTFYPLDKIGARRKSNLNENKPFVLFSSSFSNPVKNYQLAKLAMMKVPDAELLELSNKTREEVNLLLNAVDVLLLTSPYEGSPQIIKEAMACNCPIVTTDAGDVKKIIGLTKNCYICSPDPAEMAERIKSLIKTPSRTDGRGMISSYDNKAIAMKIFNIYQMFL